MAAKFVPYQTCLRWFKWMTLSLQAYVAVVITMRLEWWQVASQAVRSQLTGGHEVLVTVLAVFGTAISPYLFFWQAAHEVEDTSGAPMPTLAQVRRDLGCIEADSIISMAFSYLTAFFIVLSTAATPHAAGVTSIQTAAQAADSLRLLAGDPTFFLFSLGIIGDN